MDSRRLPGALPVEKTSGPGKRDRVAFYEKRKKRPGPFFKSSLLLILAIATIAAVVSYRSGGLAHVLVTSLRDPNASLAELRVWVLGWGALAPAAYVAAVIVEVLVAPIPGTLLYAPAGAIFGGGWGGTLSLVGNVAGATMAGAIGRYFGARLAARLDASRLASLADRLRKRGVLVIALLRINLFTSSDLVSYAAGVARVPVWQISLGTLIGMAPLCYAQAYLAQQLFDWLPGSGLILLAFGLAYVVAVLALLLGK